MPIVNAMAEPIHADREKLMITTKTASTETIA